MLIKSEWIDLPCWKFENVVDKTISCSFLHGSIDVKGRNMVSCTCESDLRPPAG